MKFDKHDDVAALAWEKGVRLNERLGPSFQVQYPNFLPNLKKRIARDPIDAYEHLQEVSGGASYIQSRVNQQEGGSYSGNKKRDRHKEIEQVLIDLAQAHGKHDPQNPDYTAVKDRVMGKLKIWSERKKRLDEMSEAEWSDLSPEVRKQLDEDLSPDVEALDHLAGLSQRRIYDIIREHRDRLLPEISLSPKA